MRINPCVEKLSEMESVENGKFCNSCGKTVIDLTGKSDQEIRWLYEQNNGELCGIVGESQLQENRYYHPLKRFALALIIVFGTSLFVFANRDGFISFQQKAMTQMSDTNVKHELKGFVYGDAGALVGAEIFCELDGQQFIAQTDMRGEFILKLPDTELNEVILNISYAGYESQTKHITLKEEGLQFVGKTTLESHDWDILMGEVAYPVEQINGNVVPKEEEVPPPPPPMMVGKIAPPKSVNSEKELKQGDIIAPKKDRPSDQIKFD